MSKKTSSTRYQTISERYLKDGEVYTLEKILNDQGLIMSVKIIKTGYRKELFGGPNNEK